MTPSERDLLRRMAEAVSDLMGLAESIHRYGEAFPGEPQDDFAMKKARDVLDETREYLERTSRQ